jgi:hypothetical protein
MEEIPFGWNYVPIENVIDFLEFEDSVNLGLTCKFFKKKLEKPYFVKKIRDSKYKHYFELNGSKNAKIGDKLFVCDDHPKLTRFIVSGKLQNHLKKHTMMGACIYCSMNGTSHFVNPFNFNLNIIECGYNDAKKKADFIPSVGSELYNFGKALAKEGVSQKTINLLQV